MYQLCQRSLTSLLDSQNLKNQIQIRKLEIDNEEVKENFKVFEEIRKLKSKLKEIEESQKDAEDNLEKLSKLFHLGIIDVNGEYINNDMR